MKEKPEKFRNEHETALPVELASHLGGGHYVSSQGWCLNFSFWVLGPTCLAKLGSLSFLGGSNIFSTFLMKKFTKKTTCSGE